MEDKAYKWFFYILAALIFVVIYFGSLTQKHIEQRNYELEQEKNQLLEDIQYHKAKADSLDSLLLNVKPDTAVVIKNRIITRYEKDFHFIDSANSDVNFRIFTSWLPENDSVGSW